VLAKRCIELQDEVKALSHALAMSQEAERALRAQLAAVEAELSAMRDVYAGMVVDVKCFVAERDAATAQRDRLAEALRACVSCCEQQVRRMDHWKHSHLELDVTLNRARAALAGEGE